MTLAKLCACKMDVYRILEECITFMALDINAALSRSNLLATLLVGGETPHLLFIPRLTLKIGT